MICPTVHFGTEAANGAQTFLTGQIHTHAFDPHVRARPLLIRMRT